MTQERKDWLKYDKLFIENWRNGARTCIVVALKSTGGWNPLSREKVLLATLRESFGTRFIENFISKENNQSCFSYANSYVSAGPPGWDYFVQNDVILKCSVISLIGIINDVILKFSVISLIGTYLVHRRIKTPSTQRIVQTVVSVCGIATCCWCWAWYCFGAMVVNADGRDWGVSIIFLNPTTTGQCHPHHYIWLRCDFTGRLTGRLTSRN